MHTSITDKKLWLQSKFAFYIRIKLLKWKSVFKCFLIENVTVRVNYFFLNVHCLWIQTRITCLEIFSHGSFLFEFYHLYKFKQQHSYLLTEYLPLCQHSNFTKLYPNYLRMHVRFSPNSSVYSSDVWVDAILDCIMNHQQTPQMNVRKTYYFPLKS